MRAPDPTQRSRVLSVLEGVFNVSHGTSQEVDASSLAVLERVPLPASVERSDGRDFDAMFDDRPRTLQKHLSIATLRNLVLVLLGTAVAAVVYEVNGTVGLILLALVVLALFAKCLQALMKWFSAKVVRSLAA